MSYSQFAKKYNLVILCIIYIAAAASEYWILNWLSQLYDVKLPIFAALLQNASWPIQIVFYKMEREKYFIENLQPRFVTMKMIQSYIILGALSSFITLTRTIGITSLPPTIYVICANTEIVFETIMTKVVLKRTISYLQLLAVSFVITGVLISLYNPKTNKFGDNDNVSQQTLLLGVVVSLSSRLASSLNTILADRFLGKDAKSRMGVLECALANSVIPSAFLPIILTFVPEYNKWDILTSYRTQGTIMIGLLCCGVTISKHADRLAKFSIVSEASTMFYAAVDAFMKVIAGIGSFLFFKDAIYWPQILGFVMIFFALIIMYYDKKIKTTVVETRRELITTIRNKSVDLEATRDSQVKLERALSRASSFGILYPENSSVRTLSRSVDRSISRSSVGVDFEIGRGKSTITLDTHSLNHARSSSAHPSESGQNDNIDIDIGIDIDDEMDDLKDTYELRYSIVSP